MVCPQRSRIKPHSTSTTLQEAIAALSEDEVVKEALGAEYARYYLDVKRNEWTDYHRSVSQWELERYLKTY